MSIRFKSTIVRFLKGFLSVEVPIIVAQLGNVTDITNIAQVKSFAFSLVLPTISGALLAAEKWMRWDPAQ